NSVVSASLSMHHLGCRPRLQRSGAFSRRGQRPIVKSPTTRVAVSDEVRTLPKRCRYRSCFLRFVRKRDNGIVDREFWHSPCPMQRVDDWRGECAVQRSRQGG